MDKTSSLLATHLWDIRASLESQVRCLTTIQRNLTEFRKASDERDRERLRTSVLSDLSELGQLSFTVIQTLKPTVEQADIELNIS